MSLLTTSVVHIGGKFTADVTTFNANLRKNVTICVTDTDGKFADSVDDAGSKFAIDVVNSVGEP